MVQAKKNTHQIKNEPMQKRNMRQILNEIIPTKSG